MIRAATTKTKGRNRFLELVSVLSGSGFAGLLIGTLQHYLGFGVRSHLFGREAFELACFEGGIIGAIFAVPTGLITYYGALQGHVTQRQVILIVVGSLFGGCVLGTAFFVLSALMTPILTVGIAWSIRLSRRSRI